MKLHPDIVAKINARISPSPPVVPIEERLSEREFQAAVIALAKVCGWMVYHTHDSRKSEAGFPDLTLVRPGRLIFAELKAADGRVSAPQATWMEALQAAGVEVFLWRPCDWPNVVAVLREGQS